MDAKGNNAADNTAIAQVHTRKVLLTTRSATAATPHPVSGHAFGKLTAPFVAPDDAARPVISLLSTISETVRLVSVSSRVTP